MTKPETSFTHSRNPIKRNIQVTIASASGFRRALKSDAGVQQWTVIVPILIVIACFIASSAIEWAILVLPLGIVYVAELFNTAIEITLDRISTNYDEEIKFAKDVASAAVYAAAIFAALIWLVIIAF